MTNNQAAKTISLDTLTPREIERIMDEFRRQKERAEDHYTTRIEPRLKHRREVCRATREHYRVKFPRLAESSDWTSRDVKTTIDWILPLLLEAFCSSEDAVTIQGVGPEDDEAARRVQALLKYQLERKNRYFTFLSNVLRSALEVNLGIGKVYWHREETATPEQTILTDRDRTAWLTLRQDAANGKIRIRHIRETDHGIHIAYDRITTRANYPILEYLPPSEFRYTPDGLTIADAQFQAHRKIVTADHLRRQEKKGIYQNVDTALTDAPLPIACALEHDTDPARADSLYQGQGASRRIELYEGYLAVDYNGDGIAEQLIVHAVGNTPLRIATNEFEQAPFFTCAAEPDPNTSFGENGFADNLEQLQDLKTALVRQIIINIAKNNAPRQFIDERTVDMDALLAGDEYIPVSGDLTGSIYCPPALPLSAATMELIQYAQTEIESQSGSTRYNQGLDAASLNHTATGITTIMGAADKRVRHIARHIAESFLIPLVRFIIRLNQKFLSPGTICRLLENTITIEKTDLDLDYDLTVSVGQGLGTKEAEAQYLALLIEKLFPILAQEGIIRRDNWYQTAKELLEKLGIRNTARFLTEPDPIQRQAEQTLAQTNATLQTLQAEQTLAQALQAQAMQGQAPQPQPTPPAQPAQPQPTLQPTAQPTPQEQALQEQILQTQLRQAQPPMR